MTRGACISVRAAAAGRLRVLAAAMTLLLASGCEDPAGPAGELARDEEAFIQTDDLAYRLVQDGDLLETDIAYTYRNGGAIPLFLQNCNGAFGIVLEKLEGDEWRVVWGNVVPECLSQAIAVLPGQAIQRTLHVSGGRPLCQCGQAFATPRIDGVYRMVVVNVFDAQTGEGFAAGTRVPIALRTSNRFILEE